MGTEQSVQEGTISISIRATDDSKGCVVDLEGETKQIATDSDFTAFGLSIDKLKNIAQSKNPSIHNLNFVFFKSPALVYRFRSTKRAAQCIKIFKPVRYTIITKKPETIAVSTRTLKNRSKITGTYKNDMSRTETNTISTKWSRNETFTARLKVDHKINLGSGEISYTSYNSEEKESSSTVTIESESSVSVKLAPGQEVVAKIRLLKQVYEVEIEYEASLTGTVTVVWDFWIYKEWYYDVVDLLKSAGLENKVTLNK